MRRTLRWWWPAPEVRNSVALDALEAANAIPALDGLVLDFDHYGRVVGLQVTGAADSILAPSCSLALPSRDPVSPEGQDAPA